MEALPAQLKTLAEALAENKAKITISKRPNGGYSARSADKYLPGCISEVKSKDGKYHYINLSGKGNKPDAAALDLIENLPTGEGSIAFGRFINPQKDRL